MSLILCRQEPVTSPYFVEELGVHLYSSQELNYVIYHHPLLVMEDFVNERLAAFLRTELRLPFLAERIQKWIQSRGPSDELFVPDPPGLRFLYPGRAGGLPAEGGGPQEAVLP